MPDTEDGLAYEDADEEPVAMIEESPEDGGSKMSQLGMPFIFLSNEKERPSVFKFWVLLRDLELLKS